MRYILTFILFSTTLLGEAQEILQRIEMEFSIKEINPDGSKRLTMGNIYYDRQVRELIYDISFPEEVMFVFKDTVLAQIKNDSVTFKPSVPTAIDYSIFHLTLSGNLQYFGLNKSNYQLVAIDENDAQKISTWKAPPPYDEQTGNLKLSQVGNKLDAFITYDINDEILAKQYFRNYIDLGLVQFPQKVIEVNYLEKQEAKKLSTYRNIKLNVPNNENYRINFDMYTLSGE